MQFCKTIMGFNTQGRLKKPDAVLQNKSHGTLKKCTTQECTHTYMCVCYSRYIEYALGRRNLNADGTAKSWALKYLFNVEWESCPNTPFSVQMFFVMQFTKYSFRSCSTVLETNYNKNQKILNYIKTFFQLNRSNRRIFNLKNMS